MADQTRLFEDLVSTAPLKANRRLDMVDSLYDMLPSSLALHLVDFQCLQSGHFRNQLLVRFKRDICRSDVFEQIQPLQGSKPRQLYVDRTEIPVRVAAFPFAVPPEIHHASRECLTLGLIICKPERGTHRHLFPPEGVILDGDRSLNRKDWNNTIFQTMEAAAAGPTLEWTEQDTSRRLRT